MQAQRPSASRTSQAQRPARAPALLRRTPPRAFELPKGRPVNANDLKQFIHQLVIARRSSKGEIESAITRTTRRLVVVAMDELVSEGKVKFDKRLDFYYLSPEQRAARTPISSYESVNPFNATVTLESMKECILELLTIYNPTLQNVSEFVVAKLLVMVGNAVADLVSKKNIRETPMGFEPIFTQPDFKLRDQRAEFTDDDVERYLIKLLVLSPARYGEILRRFTCQVPLDKREHLIMRVDAALARLQDSSLINSIEDGKGAEFMPSALLEERALKVQDAVKRYLVRNRAPIRSDFVETRIARLVDVPEIPEDQRKLLVYAALAQLEQLGLVGQTNEMIGTTLEGRPNYVSKWTPRYALLKREPLADEIATAAPAKPDGGSHTLTEGKPPAK